MKIKIKRAIWVVLLAVIFITLSCPGGFAEMNVGPDYTLGGYISLGGGWLSDQPRHMDRAYLKQYVPFPQGFLAETDLSLKSKDGLEYYNFRMSHPGLRDQDYLLQLGKLGVYHAEIEYDQLQHLYCDVNPFNNNIGILLQRLRFSGYYSPTLDITLFAEDQFLRRTGWQAASNNAGPGTGAYNFTTYLRPIDYKQNDLRVGVEYDQPTDQKSIFQGRLSYHLSTFENGQGDVLGRTPQPVGTPPTGATIFDSLPPSNMANYINGEGALDLKSYLTRITGSVSYGWLSQNDNVFESTTAAATATAPATLAGRSDGLAGLGASTFTANIAGVTRPIAPLALRYSYNAYRYGDTNNMSNQVLRTAFGAIDNPNLLTAEHYSYFRQGVNLGADYRVNNMLAFNVGYSWKGFNRTDGQGNSSSHSPQVGLKLTATDWLSLLTNYTLTIRNGYNNVAFIKESGEGALPLTYKSYSGDLIRNNFNFIAELYPVNNVTTSFNFSIYNDNFTDSAFGIQSDRGWSVGADVSWRPHDRVALSLGYDHQQLQTRTLTPNNSTTNLIFGEQFLVGGDTGPTLTTSDSYDTFVARADFKLIPKKLFLSTRGSYSFSNSNFHNNLMTNLNEYYADINTFLTYKFDEHWAVRAGYIFQIFHMSNEYGTLYLRGTPTAGAGSTAANFTASGAAGNNQNYNTLDGYYRNATAHLVQGFVQYHF